MAFPDQQWFRDAVALFNADPDAFAAASGWSGNLGLLVGEQIGVFVAAPIAGKLPEPEFMSADALQQKKPEYFARASEADWKALISGELDPIAAIVTRKLVAQGNLAQFIARLKFRGLAERWLAGIRALKG